MNFLARGQARAELKKLLQGGPDFTVHTPRQLIASALWDYGEDALAARALAMSEDERAKVDKISAWYEKPDYPLPMTRQRITHNHVAAFAAITLFEGHVRPLARTRRRPAKDPSHLRGMNQRRGKPPNLGIDLFLLPLPSPGGAPSGHQDRASR